MRRYLVHALFVASLQVTFGSDINAQSHPAVPAFSSNPGAPYTVYLDFAGFAYNGTWDGVTMGTQAAYNGQAGASFTVAEQANIKSLWTRVSEQYSPFNVNVTTVDPAVAAGQNANDTVRQNYYDATARLMHTVIGVASSSSIYPGAGGVSFVDVISTAQSNGLHTNWVFSNRYVNNDVIHNIGTATSHENGHAFGLWHQADYTGNTLVNGYSRNNNSPTIAPTVGVAYAAARPAWRLGDADAPGGRATQNDPLQILTGNTGIGNFVNDGVGHTRPTATPLPLFTSNAINFNLAKGIIVPASSTASNPIGANNYTFDYFSFTTTGGLNTINLVAGRQAITPGFADPDAMLDDSLSILDSVGNVLGTANTASLGETLALNLAPGNYFVEVSSAGGKASDTNGGVWNPASFYDMGSYFLTGAISVPEPTTIALCGLFGVGVVCYGWRYRRQRGAALDQEIDAQ